MNKERQQYVVPAVLRLDYEVDPTVTLARICKDFNAGTGAARAGCRTGTGSAGCSDITPS